MLKSILIVEDDPLVALMLEGYLDALGYEVAASCETIAAALARIESERIGAAIVDVHLANGELAGPVVEALPTKGIPFFVTTGGHTIVSDPRFEGAAMLSKPFGLADLEAALAPLARAAADCFFAPELSPLPRVSKMKARPDPSPPPRYRAGLPSSRPARKTNKHALVEPAASRRARGRRGPAAAQRRPERRVAAFARGDRARPRRKESEASAPARPRIGAPPDRACEVRVRSALCRAHQMPLTKNASPRRARQWGGSLVKKGRTLAQRTAPTHPAGQKADM